MNEQHVIHNFNINFRNISGAYFATFDATTGKMIMSSNSTIEQLFKGKDLRAFIVFCHYNEFEFWG